MKKVVGILIMVAIAALVVAGGFSLVFAEAGPASKYVGAGKCKNCHSSEKKGNQYGKWSQSAMAKAYQTLATDQAKELGKKAGVDDPQKSDKCLKCHVTAYGEAKDKVDDNFDTKMGVQCESCHGPGGNHVKARVAAAAEDTGDDVFGGGAEGYVKVPEGEIVSAPKAEVCQKCHNKESPSFKSFNFDDLEKKNQHLDPRKKR